MHQSRRVTNISPQLGWLQSYWLRNVSPLSRPIKLITHPLNSVSVPVDPTPSTQIPPPQIPSVLPAEMVQAVTPAAMIQSQSHPHPMQQAQLTTTPSDTLVHHQQAAYPYTVYHEIDPSRAIHPAAAAPPQTWQATNGIAPQQTHIAPPPHMMPRHTHAYREDQTWPGGYQQQQPQQAATMVAEVPAYDFRYRDDQNWVTTAGQYYDQQVMSQNIRCDRDETHRQYSTIRHTRSPNSHT